MQQRDEVTVILNKVVVCSLPAYVSLKGENVYHIPAAPSAAHCSLTQAAHCDPYCRLSLGSDL